MDLNTNEVQTITTSTIDVNEIQVVTTYVTARNEVQGITVSPPPGHHSLNGAWSYSLKLDTSGSGAMLQYSGQISATAGIEGYRYSLKSMLEAMSNIEGDVSISKSDQNPDGGFTYFVTFPLSMGDVPELEVYFSDLPVSISTIENGNILNGSFRLEFEGEITDDIPFDSSSSNLRSQLENLSSVGSVSVVRRGPTHQNTFSWEIEFTSDLNSGNLHNIIPHGHGLKTTNGIGGASIAVSHGGRDGSFITGTFQLEFGENIY